MAEQFPPAANRSSHAQPRDDRPAGRQQAGKRAAPSPGANAAGTREQEVVARTPHGWGNPPEALRDGSPRDGSPRDGSLGPSAPHHRQAYAALDLGTNNCRLLIARPSGENFTVIDAFSRVVRLGEGLAQNGRLSEAAMDRALAALVVCAEKLMRRKVFLARSVATEACRRADNGEQFIERVRSETGIVLDIISAREEARLAVLGCHVLLEPGIGPAMIFDIGGGSTELVLIESTDTVPRILDWQSVPWGVVSLTESCAVDCAESGGEGRDEATRRRRYARMKAIVRDAFSGFAVRVSGAREEAARAGGLRLLGTSGTVTTLASVHLDLPQYDRRAVDGLIVPTESMRDISTRLSTMSIGERRELPCIGRERADLVVAGCAILEAILDLWPAARLGVADRGIREGILRGLISAHEHGSLRSAAQGIAAQGGGSGLGERPLT